MTPEPRRATLPVVLGPGRPYRPPSPRHPNRKEPRTNAHHVRAAQALHEEAAQRGVEVVPPFPCPPHVALGALRRAGWSCARCGRRDTLHLGDRHGDLPEVVCTRCAPLRAVERPSPCPECPGTLRLRVARHGGLFYRCDHAPRCGCVRASALDGTPVGALGTKDVRALRGAVRRALEAAARDLGVPRVEVYRAVASACQADNPTEFRVGLLDDAGCRAALDAIQTYTTTRLLAATEVSCALLPAPFGL